MTENLDLLRDSSRSQSEQVTDAASQAKWNEEKWVWVTHKTECFIHANILDEQGDNVKVKLLTGEEVVYPLENVFKMNPPKFDKTEDMAALSHLNEPAVYDNLKKRYYSGLIYTYSGLFCVVVNPYKKLQIYSNEIVEAYRGKRRSEMPPHVFSITDTAYRGMMLERENQSILVTGESGAGKTENTKKVIQYLVAIATGDSQSQGKLEKQIQISNPLLEAFGNAKTTRNNNSSRFGKFIRVEFDKNGFISGGNIQFYLLEKSRSVRQNKGERNFHIFYQLLRFANNDLKKELLLDDESKYPILSHKADSTIEGVDDAEDAKELFESMEVIGISKEEIKFILRMLSGMLKLSCIEFSEDRSQQATIEHDTVVSMACKLLGLSVPELIKGFLRPRIKAGRDYVHKAQSANQAKSSLEGIIKAVYSYLFASIVSLVNKALDTKKSSSNFIGILDIAGFEIFEINAFEQLCINYTNEKLQQFFNQHMFYLEQEEYLKEGIEWEFIDFGLDLEPCIKLIESKLGILSLLDEESLLLPNSNDETFVSKLSSQHLNKSQCFSKLEGKIKRNYVGFLIQHYAGVVEYQCDSWLVVNSDPLNSSVLAVFHDSSDHLVKELFKIYAPPTLESRRRGTFRTVGANHKGQLSNLMNSLRSTQPHFIRCIIPNHEKKAGKLVASVVLDQLRCNGVLEGIRICRKGFPNRIPFQDFKFRYEVLTPRVIPKGFMDGKLACEKILSALDEIDKSTYRIGHTKIFFKAGILAQLEELRDQTISNVVRSLQAYGRAYSARRFHLRLSNQEGAIIMIQKNCQQYLVLRKWPWWRLFCKIQPLLKFTQEDNLKKEMEELKKQHDTLEKTRDKNI